MSSVLCYAMVCHGVLCRCNGLLRRVCRGAVMVGVA